MSENMRSDEQQILLDEDEQEELKEEVKVEVVHPVMQPHQSSDTLQNQIERTNDSRAA